MDLRCSTKNKHEKKLAPQGTVKVVRLRRRNVKEEKGMRSKDKSHS